MIERLLPHTLAPLNSTLPFRRVGVGGGGGAVVTNDRCIMPLTCKLENMQHPLFTSLCYCNDPELLDRQSSKQFGPRSG